MKLADFEMLPKGNLGLRGNQAILNFGEFDLSIIDDGYGREQGLFEISVFKDGDQCELPGITEEGDTVKGFLTESDVDAIIKKMHSITGKEPTQV